MDYLSLDEPTELRVSRAVDSRGTRENPPTIYKYQESFLAVYERICIVSDIFCKACFLAKRIKPCSCLILFRPFTQIEESLSSALSG